jgi:hypothetical protein
MSQSMTPREAELTTLLQETQAALQRSLRENQLLREKINLLVRRVFGSSSEALDTAQLQLLLSQSGDTSESLPAPAAAPESSPAARVSRKARSTRLPENLPVVEEVLDPEAVKAEPDNWRCIGQEVSEQLDYEPGRFLRRRLVRRKYVHRSDPDRAPVIAPLPQSLQERCLATLSAGANLCPALRH